MNLFIGNSPYYHLLKYLQFLLKHPVYSPMMSTFHPKHVAAIYDRYNNAVH